MNPSKASFLQQLFPSHVIVVLATITELACKIQTILGTGQGMRGAFKVFGPSPEGIGLTRFREMLTTVGIQLPKSDALRLFSKYDDDGSGHIDMYELMRNLLPSDYKGKTWQQKSFERTTNHHDDKNTERKKQGQTYKFNT
jgi:hypothetical protein